MKSKAKANVNIALIKYWGKADEKLKIPFQSSLSFTLDKFYTVTEVTYDKDLLADVLYIDDGLITGSEYLRVTKYMDVIRKMYQIPYYALIKSVNHVAKKAGLASSSSAFCALALAATSAYQIKLDKQELSKLARLGSGSASRSVYPGFAIWDKGYDHDSSYASYFASWDDFRIIVCLVSKDEKQIGSTEAMAATINHKNYHKWITKCEADLVIAKEAIINRDINKLGETASSNALYMHQLLNEVGINYFNTMTYKILDRLKTLNVPAYPTIDAGPNVKIITTKEHVAAIVNQIEDLVEVVVCQSGMGVELID